MKFSHFVLSVFLGLCSFYASAFDPAEPAPFTIKIDGTGHERVVASAYDNDANLYVAGYYQNGSNTTISSFSDGPNTDGQRVLDTYNTLPENNGGQDLFIAKFNWQGQIQWIKFAGGLGKDGATGIAFDRKSGQLFVTGYIQGSVDFALTQVNATGNSSGLDNDTSTNLFISVLDVTTGEWLDIQTFPLVAEVTDTLDNPIGGAHIQNLEITGGDRALGNGITIAQDESDVSAPVVFYIKGQVKNTHQIVSNMTPANGQTWLARLALNTTVPANSDTYTVADLLGSGGNTSTSGSGHWSFITKVSYIENPNPLVGQVRWNWNWLTQLNQGVTPIQGASDAYVESCYAVDTGNNLIIEQQSASDNSNVWNLDQNIDAGSPQFALQFNDPLPSGATLTSIAVGVDFSLLLGNELGPISYNFNAAMEGITLGEYSIPPTLAPVSPPAYFPASTTINYNSSLATYNEGGQNTLVFNHVAGESIKLTKVVLTLNYLSQTGEPCHMDVVTDMEVDPAQGLSSPLYFSGEWRSGFKIASDTYESEEGGRNGYVASLTPNGNWRFFAQVKGYSSIQGIEFNAESNLIATGFAGLSSASASNVTFDSSGLLPNPAALTPGTYGTTSALFAEINGNGQWLWGAVNTSVAASFDLKKSLDGSFVTTGTTTSDSSTNAFVARFADANNANFIWTQTNSENATFGYHLLVNNLDSLYVFGGTQQHYSAPYTTSLTNNTVAYSDIDDTTADQLTGLGTQIHVLDPVSGEFQTDFQNYHEYVVGNLITPQITGDNFQNTLSMRRSIPTNIGIENTTNGNGIPLNEPLLTIQADLAIYAGGPIDQAVILWPTINNTQFAYQPLVGKAVRIRWPSVEEGLQEYLYSITEGVEIPNIPLNPPGATENYQWFQFSETLAGEPQTEGTISNAQEELVTTATRMGSLVFFPGGNTATEHPTVVSIRSYPWDDANKHTDNIGLEIGTTAPAPANLVLDGVDAGGYVMTPLGRYDTKTEVYERETRLGQIIPVNLNGEEDIDGEAGGDYADDLRVAWYQQGAVNLNWPFVTHSYTPFWPTDPGLIVLTSQLGSGGLKDGVEQQQEGMIPSDPDTSDTTIYYQNDRTVPGFNPNEEHAHLVAKTGLYVAHAIRNDLNNLYQLTSDPYVLVRYYYGPLAEYRYRIFKVDYSSDDYPNFQLTSQAGNKVPAPNYFSDWVASNTHPANDATDDAFYIDRNDEVWSRSAETNIDVNYFYEITNDSFWYDVDGVEGADVVLGGQIPWMNFHNEGEGDTSVPHTLTYINSWPEDIITVYIGDTLFGNISNKKH
ncbi:MAG: hypothetical protein MI976_12205, partial [Pseudomonadales bacterium]|nr:hypothetical protein [Pseudomonadales bacterium]